MSSPPSSPQRYLPRPLKRRAPSGTTVLSPTSPAKRKLFQEEESPNSEPLFASSPPSSSSQSAYKEDDESLPWDYHYWAEAKRKAWDSVDRLPNAYYSKYSHPGIPQAAGKWSPDEHELFMDTLKVCDPVACGWGVFAQRMMSSGRTGNQCRAYYLLLLQKGTIQDGRYLGEDGVVLQKKKGASMLPLPPVLPPAEPVRRMLSLPETLSFSANLEDLRETEKPKSPPPSKEMLPAKNGGAEADQKREREDRVPAETGAPHPALTQRRPSRTPKPPSTLVPPSSTPRSPTKRKNSLSKGREADESARVDIGDTEVAPCFAFPAPTPSSVNEDVDILAVSAPPTPLRGRSPVVDIVACPAEDSIPLKWHIQTPRLNLVDTLLASLRKNPLWKRYPSGLRKRRREDEVGLSSRYFTSPFDSKITLSLSNSAQIAQRPCNSSLSNSRRRGEPCFRSV